MQHPLLSAHAVCLRCCLYRSTVCNFFGARFAHATVPSATRNSIDQLAWEPCDNYTVLCQGYSTTVGEHHSCRMQVSSILQQCKEDDLLLVAIDTQRHSSHHKIVLEEKPFLRSTTNPKSGSCGGRRDQSVSIISVCLGNLLKTIWPFALRKLPYLSVLMVSAHRPVT